METNKNAIARRINNIRLTLGKNTREFGEMFDPPASDSIVSRWESAKSLPNSKRLAKIADLGDISVNELLYGSVWEYSKERINSICKKHGISDSYFYSVYSKYLPSLKESFKDMNPKEVVINNFIYTLYDENILLYSFIENKEFENAFFMYIEFDPVTQGTSFKEKINTYINEIMEIEITQFQNQKYKLLYDPILKEKILETILIRYDFEGLTDTGIKQNTKEWLEYQLNFIEISKNYVNPYTDSNAIEFTINILNILVKQNVNEYFIKDNATKKDCQLPFKEIIKNELSYETFLSINEVIYEAKKKLIEINDNKDTDSETEFFE